MISEQSRNLFKRSIAFSGAAINFWAIPQIQNFGQKVAEVLGLTTTNETQILEFLENATAHELVAAQFGVPTDDEKFTLKADISIGPVIEPAWSKTPFLNKEPMIAARTAWSNANDAIFGANEFEGLFQSYMEHHGIINGVIETFNSNPAYFAPLLHLKLNATDPKAQVYGERIRSLYFDNSTSFTSENLNQFYRVKNILMKSLNIIILISFSLLPITLSSTATIDPYNRV